MKFNINYVKKNNIYQMTSISASFEDFKIIKYKKDLILTKLQRLFKQKLK